MAPVTRTFELYRPKVTAGETIGASSGAVSSVAAVTTVNGLAANVITAASIATDAADEIADAVWDEAISGHLVSGSTGAALNAAGAGGDPRETSLPGAYGAGTAGKIIGDNLDASVSSRLAAANIALSSGKVTVGTNDDKTGYGLADGAITEPKIASNAFTAAKFAAGAFDAVWTVTTRTLSSFGTLVADIWANATRTLTAGTKDSEIDAIKAKTDNLPASPAATGDVPTANQNADALLDRTNGIESGWTVRKVLRVVFSALAGKLSGADTTTVNIRDVSDSKNRLSATVDENGNRVAVTLDGD
jgi:hypothetical protein